jgi:Holliday junction resolvase RusA-like endonuclease
MTRADAWKKRPCVLRYRRFRDQVRLHQIRIPESGAQIVFYFPMPASWAKRKLASMAGMPHQQKPDLDNLIKALLDAIFDDDCRVWSYAAEKRWATEGAIEITENPKADTSLVDNEHRED